MSKNGPIVSWIISDSSSFIWKLKRTHFRTAHSINFSLSTDPASFVKLISSCIIIRRTVSVSKTVYCTCCFHWSLWDCARRFSLYLHLNCYSLAQCCKVLEIKLLPNYALTLLAGTVRGDSCLNSAKLNLQTCWIGSWEKGVKTNEPRFICTGSTIPNSRFKKRVVAEVTVNLSALPPAHFRTTTNDQHRCCFLFLLLKAKPVAHFSIWGPVENLCRKVSGVCPWSASWPNFALNALLRASFTRKSEISEDLGARTFQWNERSCWSRHLKRLRKCAVGRHVSTTNINVQLLNELKFLSIPVHWPLWPTRLLLN